MKVALPKFVDPSPIPGVKWVPLQFFHDPRGWLCELFRNDLIDPEFHPVMAYVSQTKPGVVRGPHEHVDQADYFCFFGPGTFRVKLWDNRPASAAFGTEEIRDVWVENPYAVIVPPGVVHGYQNIGAVDGLVFNGANRLYAGWLKQDPVDEIRHEKDPASKFKME